MRFLPLAALAGSLALPAQAATFFFTDTPYLSAADIPAGFYGGGSPTFLEDFQDNSFDGGITASNGLISFGTASFIDTVEVTDGNRGSFGTAGEVVFTFAAPVTAAGLVWTDGAQFTYTFEALGPGGTSLGSISRALGDTDFFSGTKDDDRFFGVTDAGGITAIKMTAPVFLTGMEFDHIQYGSMFVAAPPPPPPSPDPSVIPLPAGLPLLAGALGLMAVLRRRA